jgi:hypothetical protein
MIKWNGSLSVTQDTDGKKIYKPIAREDSFGKKICDALTPGCLKTRRVYAESGGSKKRAKKTRKQRKPRNSKRNHKK